MRVTELEAELGRSLTEAQRAEYVGTWAIWQWLREQEQYALADHWREKYAEWDRTLSSPFRAYLDGSERLHFHPWFASDKKLRELRDA